MNRRMALAGIAILTALPLGIGAQKASSKQRVNQLKSNLNSIQRKKNDVRQKLNKTQKEVRAVKGDLNEVDARLTHVENLLEDTNDRLDKGRSEQKRLGNDLVAATNRMTVVKEQVRKRLRWMYVHGQSSFVSVLTGADNVGDIATRKFLMERIAVKDREVFDEYKTLRREIASKKQRQDRLVVEIRGLAETQRQQQGSLETVRVEKEGVLKGLRAQQSELQKMLAQFAADERQIQSQIEAFLRAQSSGGKNPGPAPKGKFFRPCNGRLSSNFGNRYHPILHVYRMHAGVDFGAPYGSAIYAANDGVVIASQQMRGFGNVVIIDHGGSISTVYGHCSRLLVKSGQRVKRGQRIANVGSTGLSTGPHLHFEVRVKGKAVNPMRYL